MSYEYELVGSFPFQNPESEAIAVVADVLGAPVVHPPGLSARVQVEGLLVYAVEPDDEEDRDTVTSQVGFDSNLSLILVDRSGASDDLLITVMQDLIKIMIRFAQTPNLKGILLSEFADRHIALRIDETGLTLNRAWDGWSLWPEVLGLVPEPHLFDDLRLSR